MSPRPLRPVNLLSPEDNSPKMWIPNQKPNEISGLVMQTRTRPNIQNLFPIEKPKYQGARGESPQQIQPLKVSHI
jgi:hypothetical protein